MDDQCKDLINHIGRLQGQLESVKKELQRGDSAQCGKASRTLLSSLRSFEGLRTAFITMFLDERFLAKRALSSGEKTELKDLLALIKG
jgi:DNA-binding FrmR family transcriptional regulator